MDEGHRLIVKSEDCKKSRYSFFSILQCAFVKVIQHSG